MKSLVITREVQEFLRDNVFITVGTSDSHGKPRIAPKLLLKVEGDYIYIIDYVIGKMWQNIKINPHVSLSVMNIDTLVGYQINGSAQIIAKGKEYTALLKQYQDKQVQSSAERILEGIRRDKTHGIFEISFSEKMVVFKVKAEEVVEIAPAGGLKRMSEEAP